MKTTMLPMPGIVLGPYPERNERLRDPLAPGGGVAASLSPRHRGLRDYQRLAARAVAIAPDVARLDVAAWAQRLRQLRSAMATQGFADELVVEALALVGRACADSLGKQPYATQLLAAAIMLDGQLAEMATGEGKTLAAAVCAATAALAGVPVHVMTANDYLVARDAVALRPLYDALGLSVGMVTQQARRDTRREAYARDITYCTARELAFDYLRDRLCRGRLRSDLQVRAAWLGAGQPPETVLRGLCMAIVDEADSLLIDEAGMPLVISHKRSDTGQIKTLRHALEVARTLDPRDYRLQPAQMLAELTPRGKAALEQQASGASNAWRNRPHREETVCLALAALHLYCRDRHYLARNGEIGIIDETTGRLAAGRVWSRGLHQLVELKEGCRPSDEQLTAAQMTFQRFFRRYLRLCGLSGTLSEARGELRAVYGLRVVNVPLRKPGRRRLLPARLYPDRQARWRAAASRAVEVSGSGRPVLIGTDSVVDSEQLSRQLALAGVEHAVLNARQDAAEAMLIASAGQSGRITVATNMAGRGTDIALGPGVAERGGLHVICCQHNSAARIDRQLIGRCARQGDPGSTETMLAADQPLLARWIPAWLRTRIPELGMQSPRWLVRLLWRLPQWLEEARRRDQRRALLARDRQDDLGRRFGRPSE